MAISPFIEAPFVRASTAASGGMDTSAVDHLRQGNEIKTAKHLFGSFPKIRGGGIDGGFGDVTYGQPKTFFDETPFEDLEKFDAVKFLLSDGNSSIFPLIVGNVALKDPEQLDGAIEPLTIRARASLNSIDSPFEAHGVYGGLMDGNEDVLKRSDRVTQFVDLRPPPVVEPFLDSAETFGITLTGSVVLPGLIAEESRTTNPFDESVRLKHTVILSSSVLSVGVSGDDIRTALMAMDPVDDRFLPLHHRSSAAGFTYENNSHGTDSIAFGGLKK